MTAQIHALFDPASIALVGATDKSGWSLNTFTNLRRHGFDGPVYLVNPRTEVVHGERTYPSLSDLPEKVDLAYVMVPTTAVGLPRYSGCSSCSTEAKKLLRSMCRNPKESEAAG